MTRSAIWKLQPTTLLLCGLAAAVGCTSDKAEDVAVASTREPPTKGVNRVCSLVTRSEMKAFSVARSSPRATATTPTRPNACIPSPAGSAPRRSTWIGTAASPHGRA